MTTTQCSVAHMPYAAAGFASMHDAPVVAARGLRPRTFIAPVMSPLQDSSVLTQAWFGVATRKQVSDHGKFALPRISTTRTAALSNDRDDAALGGADVTEVPGIRSCRIPV